MLWKAFNDGFVAKRAASLRPVDFGLTLAQCRSGGAE